MVSQTTFSLKYEPAFEMREISEDIYFIRKKFSLKYRWHTSYRTCTFLGNFLGNKDI